MLNIKTYFKMKAMKIYIGILFASLAFVACEQENNNDKTTGKESVEAFYSDLGECTYYSALDNPEEELTWNVKDNELVISRKNSRCECGADNSRIYTEIINDTVYVVERWYSSAASNDGQYRDMEITVLNLPKGKWVVNNILEYPRYLELNLDENSTIMTTGAVDVWSQNIFSIEVK